MPLVDAPAKIITCYVPTDAAEELLIYLSSASGVIAVNLTTGRGTTGAGAFGLAAEIAIFIVAADAARADEVFADVFERGRIDRPGGGIVFMHGTRRSTGFKLPDLPAEGGE
jgi:hypothetical protein